MDRKEKHIEQVELSVSDLKNGFGNPRKITEKKKQELKASIESYGDFGVILIDEHNNVIGGNQRVEVMKSLNPNYKVLCKRLVGYTRAELRAINIKDNTHAGEWDIEMLADWTADLNIDVGIKDELEKNDEMDRTIEEMELVPYEKYDYVLIVCKSQLDYDILTERLGIAGKTVKTRKKGKIAARAVWYDKVEDKLFGGNKKG